MAELDLQFKVTFRDPPLFKHAPVHCDVLISLIGMTAILIKFSDLKWIKPNSKLAAFV